MNSVHLHQQLVKQFENVGLLIGQAQRVNLALWCQALAVSPNCHLTTLALGLPLPGQRENLIQRLRRFLKDVNVAPQVSYRPIVQQLLRSWSDREVNLVMDRTDLTNRWSILSLGAAYRKRLLPLAWQIHPFGSTGAEDQIELLKQVQALLPDRPQVQVHFYGDSEFRAVAVQQTCQAYGWHWQVGLKSDVRFRTDQTAWQPLASLGLQPGERRYLNQIYLTETHNFGPLNLLADWAVTQPQPRYWALDLPAERHAWRRGRKRFWTEPTFRDWKSYGFDLERSQINDPDRLNSLMLAIALTTLWMIYIGDWLTRHGLAHLLTPAHKTDYSLFRLGRDYVQRCQTMGWSIPVGFTVGQA
jgi:hypothetical protein